MPAATTPLFQSLFLGGMPSPAASFVYSLLLVMVVFLPMVSLIALIGIWAERKIAGHMQGRIGPDRVGSFGLLQSVADGIKLLLKEDLCPRQADSMLFRVAPYLSFVPVFAAFLALPFGPDLTFAPRLSTGLFWLVAILSVEALGVILAGWASNNKWAVYGAMREACQMVSYEIPLGLSILAAVTAAGTLNLVELGFLQQGGLHTWLIFRNPFVLVAFFTYFIASLASNKRAPFDLPESDSELVAGYHTEYSGLRFSFFFFAEYAAMFVIAAIQVAVFLGGWNDPLGLIGRYDTIWRQSGNTGGLVVLNVIGAGIFVAKAAVLIFVQMWMRWTLPRPRIDQVLYTCVKVLLPLACALLLGAVLWELFLPAHPGIPWQDYGPWRWSAWAGHHGSLVTQSILALSGVAAGSALIGWIIYAAATGRVLRQRLTEPAPIPHSLEARESS
jgi:NADH-quinone oxidoreductase subunit H